MMEIINQIVTLVVQAVIAGAGAVFMAYGIPYLKKIGMYNIVQMTVRAAEKCGATGAIKKADKKNYVVSALQKMGITVTPTIEMMIESAVEELDVQAEKIEAEISKN